MTRCAEQAAEVDGRAQALRKELAHAEEKLKRLYRIVEDGVAELDDILKDRIAALKTDRERAQTALDRIKAQAAQPSTLDPAAIERFGIVMRENITSGAVPFRKAYLQAVIDRVEVDDATIRIVGDKSVLAAAIAVGSDPTAGVRRSVRKWRTRHDSNV